LSRGSEQRAGEQRAREVKSPRNSPAAPLINGVIYILIVAALGTMGYVIAGWNLSDAFYMVIITLFTVGYDEVHPIAGPGMRALTICLIVLGCTGMIYLTGAIVQFFTATQLQNFFGLKRMKNEIDQLDGHVIVCGFGRIGRLLSRDLTAAGQKFVVVERQEDRIVNARGMGYLCVQGEATDEQILKDAGVARARLLATVLPDDAANVFITLSARSLNKTMTIIARGEAPTTEGKLLHAGANQVVLPAHIGAERIAEMILYPDSARMIRSAEEMQGFGHNLHNLGLNLVVVTVAATSRFARLTVEDIEHQSDGAFLIVAINRRDGTTITRPTPDQRVNPGDGVVIIERSGRGGAQAAFTGTATPT
jgi:voltage-gated potassium channel